MNKSEPAYSQSIKVTDLQEQLELIQKKTDFYKCNLTVENTEELYKSYKILKQIGGVINQQLIKLIKDNQAVYEIILTQESKDQELLN